MDKISENLFTAIDTIIQSRINELNYDKTVICTITDNSERLKGLYKVKQDDGTAEFEAHSEIVSYKKGMQVYVTIPQGDYSQTKTIIGRYISNSDQIKTVRYMEPFDNCLDITGNLITGEPTAALTANGETKVSDVLWTWTSESGEDVEGFSRLGLSADFQALLNDHYPTSGSYGLLLEIDGDPIDGKIVPYAYRLDSSDMYGNPFYFDTYFNQQIVFDISNFRNIKKMEIKFYQDANFLDINGEPLPTKIGEGNFASSVGYNLFVKNLYLFLGYDLSDFNEETLILYTSDSLTYDSRIQNNPQTKNLRLRWIRKVDGNTFVQSQEDLTDSTRIYWYKYEKDTKDEIAGDFWVEIEEGKNKLELEYNPELLINSNEIKAIICYNDEMDYTWSLNEEIEKCVKYESNILKLESVYEIADQGAIDSVNALEFNFVNDIYEGVYNIYGTHKKIKNGADAVRERQIVPSLHFANGDIVQINEIDDVKVTWEVPYVNSMIVPSSEGYSKENEHYIINEKILRYKIKNLYNEQYTRNTIKCKVVYNGQTYENTINLTFGVAGTAGSDYTFVIEANKDAFTIEEDTEIVLTAKLYDYNNEVVDLTDETIKWSWLDKTSPKALMIPDTGLLGNKITLPVKDNLKEEDYYYNILKASLNVEVTWEPREDEDTPEPRNIIMEAFYAIPFRSKSTYYISGATEVVYNDAGSNPTYSKDKYQLYGDEDILEGLVWNREIYDKNEAIYQPEVRTKKLKDVNGNVYATEYFLSPKNMYISDVSNNVAVVCRQDSDLLWAQPIYVWQDKHGSTLLNRWDGSLTIDEKNGTILSTMVGAGKKDSNNTFSGVLMGDVTEASDDGMGKIGLYGFHHGEQSFGFKVDGTAFIGGSKTGRIEFNGNKGTIQSATFDEGVGMKIDLLEGTVEAHDFELSAKSESGGQIILQNLDATKPYLRIDSAEKINGKNPTLLQVGGNGEYFLQSQDYITGTSGMRIDLKEGNISAYDFTLNAKNNADNVELRLSTGSPYFNIKKSGKDLIKIASNDYFLQSEGFSSGSTDGSISARGIKINLEQGESAIEINDFLLMSRKSSGGSGKLLIHSSSNVYPFEIGPHRDSITSGLRISWDGVCEWGTFGSPGVTISSGGISTNSLSVGGSSLSSIINSAINSALSGYATQAWVEGKGYLTKLPYHYHTYRDLYRDSDGNLINNYTHTTHGAP